MMIMEIGNLYNEPILIYNEVLESAKAKKLLAYQDHLNINLASIGIYLPTIPRVQPVLNLIPQPYHVAERPPVIAQNLILQQNYDAEMIIYNQQIIDDLVL